MRSILALAHSHSTQHSHTYTCTPGNRDKHEDTHDLTEKDWELLLRGAREVTFDTGEVILEDGKSYQQLLYIVKGKASVAKNGRTLALLDKEHILVCVKLSSLEPSRTLANLLDLSQFHYLLDISHYVPNLNLSLAVYLCIPLFCLSSLSLSLYVHVPRASLTHSTVCPLSLSMYVSVPLDSLAQRGIFLVVVNSGMYLVTCSCVGDTSHGYLVQGEVSLILEKPAGAMVTAVKPTTLYVIDGFFLDVVFKHLPLLGAR
jgi:hypothetical protein